MAHRFRLQQVLNYRKAREEEAQGELAQREESLKRARQRLELFHREKEEVEDQWREQGSHTVDLLSLELTYRYHQHLLTQMGKQKQKCQQLQGEAEKSRRKVKLRWQERRVLEILREKHQERLQWEEKKREHKINDELALFAYCRKGGENRD